MTIAEWFFINLKNCDGAFPGLHDACNAQCSENQEEATADKPERPL